MSWRYLSSLDQKFKLYSHHFNNSEQELEQRRLGYNTSKNKTSYILHKTKFESLIAIHMCEVNCWQQNYLLYIEVFQLPFIANRGG